MNFVDELETLYGSSGGRLRETDQLLFLAYQDNNTSEIERLTKIVHREFFETPAGRKLAELSADHKKTTDRLLEIFRARYGENSPLYIFQLEDIARDLIAADAEAVPVPKPKAVAPPLHEPSAEETHAQLVEQIRRDMADPRIPTATIRERRGSSIAYERAWQDANTPESQTPVVPVTTEVQKFAHILNDHILHWGVPKPAVGFYTIKTNGREYRYPVAEFRRLSEDAAKAGLL